MSTTYNTERAFTQEFDSDLGRTDDDYDEEIYSQFEAAADDDWLSYRKRRLVSRCRRQSCRA